MIIDFKDKQTERLFSRLFAKKIPEEIARRAYRKLLILDAATDLNDLRIPPSNHLEKLIGDRLGQYSIRVNRQYRICFNWENGNAYKVELVDYHG